MGGNLSNNPVSLESDLRGLTRKLTRDHVEKIHAKKNKIYNEVMSYPTNKDRHINPEQSLHPVWTFRDKQQMRYDILFLNPQENVCIPFQNNLNTKLLEKDYFTS